MLHRALRVLPASDVAWELLEVPSFCQGLLVPVIVTTSSIGETMEALKRNEVQVSGILPLLPFKKAVPQASPPDPRWPDILGCLRLTSVRPSVSDSMRLRVEIAPAQDLSSLIPILARLIRGGAYRPDRPCLAFEEDHRLIAYEPDRMVFSRVDDLLEVWIILRTAVDLICLAWERRNSVAPDRESRQGIGPVEIFKRLPGTNCGMCLKRGCMEFATDLFTGRCGPDECPPLSQEAEYPRRESLLWLMEIIGRVRNSHGQ